MRIRTLAVFGAATVAGMCAFVAATGPAVAKGGGGGGGGGGSSVEPGTSVYFWFRTDTASGYSRMNADGSGKTPISLPLTYGDFPPPSRATHGGQRWYLQWREVDGLYADGRTKRTEMFAINESGAAVQLTNDPNVLPDHNMTQYVVSDLVWAGAADERVSYTGYTLGADLRPATWGVFTAAVAWGADGAPLAGTAPSSLVPGVVNPNLLQITPGNYGWSNSVKWAWSPDGSQMVYSSVAGDLQSNPTWPMWRWSGGVSTPIVDGATQRMGNPCGWSALGRVVYRGTNGADLGALVTMNPDGSSATTIVRAPKWPVLVNNPCWSPSGAFLVYWYDAGSAAQHTSTVHRIAANGTGDVSLTNDVNGHAGPIAWR